MNCEQSKALMLQERSEELRPTARFSLHQHLDECAACRAHYATLLSIEQHLSAEPDLSPSPFSERAILNAAILETRRRAKATPALRSFRLAGLASAAMVLLGLGFVLGHFQEEKPLLSAGSATTSEDPLRLLAFGRDAYQHQRYDRAIHRLTQYLSTGVPDDPALDYLATLTLARSYRRLGRHKEALATYDRLRRHPGSWQDQELLAQEVADCQRHFEDRLVDSDQNALPPDSRSYEQLPARIYRTGYRANH